VDEENLRESGGNSQAAWRSARAIASGRLVAGRPPAWTPPRRPLRRSPGARRPLRRGFNRMPEQQRQEVTTAWRSARAIASGRLVAGRPPAWTPPRRPHRRSPGAKRPLRRGFNRTPEQQRQEVTTAWRSARAIASGRLVAGRPPAWTPPRRPHRRSPGAKRPLRRGFNHTPEQQRQEVTPQAAGRSAIEIASGRLFAGRPPAWTLPRRPHRRSPGAKRPLRRGFNRTPEQQRPEVTPQPGVQRVQSPLEGFSPGVRLRGRRHGDRPGGRPARSVLSGAVSTARLSSNGRR
jgi:hypothetical protein